MTLRSATLALLLCVAHAQARTLYVSLTGSHDTNAPAFSTWATAATNIRSAIEASSSGDTVRVAPGTYFSDDGTNNIIAITNKSNLSVIGGNGTLFDADRTILDAGGTASVHPIYVDAASNRVAGFTAMNTKAQDAVSLPVSAVNCTLDSLIVRNNDMSGTKYGCGIKNLGGPGNEIRNCIVVGNAVGTGIYMSGIHNQAYLSGVGIAEVYNCISEGNTKNQIYNDKGILFIGNSIYGNAGGIITSRAGNLTSNTTNSVCQLLDIAPASEGVGTNLVWAGVSAYIPHLNSLARKNGQPYAGIETVSDGAGGPALVMSRPFLGRDATTNLNHGVPIGGVTASTNSPFAGERSAAFDGASGYLDIGKPASLDMSARTNMTIEAWVWFNNATGYRNIYESGLDHTRTYLSLYVRHESSTEGFSAGFDWGGKWWYARFGDATTAATGRWIHVSATRSGTNIWTTIDGAVVAHTIASQAQTPAYTSVRVGYNSSIYPGYFSGNLSDLRIWSVARTPAEIQANYTNRLTGTEPGLVGYWPLKDSLINPIDTGPFNLDNPIIHPSYHEAF